MRCPPTHHLVYGTLHDYLTGEELVDTDDDAPGRNCPA